MAFEYRFDHRQLEELAFSGALGEVQRGQHRECGVDTGQRIAGSPRRDGRTIGRPGHPGQPGDLLHGGGETDPVAPRDRVGFAPTMEQIAGLAWVTGLPDGPPVPPRGACDPLAAVSTPHSRCWPRWTTPSAPEKASSSSCR